jgi:putative N6-adenine-specific DNA methylase
MNPPYGERIDAKGRGSQGGEPGRDRSPRTFAAPRGDGRADGRTPAPAAYPVDPNRPRGPGADAFARDNPEAARRGPRDAPESSGGRESAIVGGASANGAGEFFSQLATHWKRHYSGWTAWVLSPDMKLPTSMRLKESRRVPMWNGPIECRLFRFDMVSGSARAGAHSGAALPPGNEA